MRYLYKFTGTKAKNPQPSSAPKHETRPTRPGLLALGTLFILLALAPARAFAWDFKIDYTVETFQNGTVTRSLYYNILDHTNHTVELTYPNTNYPSSAYWPWEGYLKPLNFLNLSSTVEHNGVTYTLTRIGDLAFYYCDEINGVRIPSTVTSIGTSAFEGCDWMDDVYINSNAIASATYTADHNFYHLFSQYPTNFTFEENVTAIGPYALYRCTQVDYVVIDGNVTTIGNAAFKYCKGIISIWLPYSLTSIGAEAFYGASNLQSVSFNSSSLSIGADAFKNCAKLNKVNLQTGNSIAAWCGYNFANAYANPLYYGNNLYLGYDKVTSLEIPSSVTRINDYVFDSCSFTSVTLPYGLQSIGKNAFFGCTGLTSINIPTTVNSIDYYAFTGCTGLQRVDINSLSAWCNINFADNTANPLARAHHLYLLGNEITALDIPNALTAIKPWTFAGGTAFTSLSIPNGVTSIGNGAFAGCNHLTTLTIPASVATIGSNTFNGCTGLQEMYVNRATPATVGSNNPFTGIAPNIPVYVPMGSKTAYQQAPQWSRFTNIIDDQNVVQVPYSQLFNGSTIPDKWQSCHGALQGDDAPYTATLTPESGRWQFGAANGVFNGSSHAYVNIGGYQHAFWLVSPFVHLGADNNMLSVDLALSRPTGTMVPMTPDAQDNTIIKVLVSTDYGTTWIPLQSWKHEMGYTDLESLLPEGHTCTYNLSAYANQDILIGFYMECTDANDASNRIHIDNFSITSFDPTLPPTAVTVSEIAGHSAKVNWTPASSVQYKWDVVVALPNTTLQNNLTQAQLEAMAANTNNFFYAHVNGYRYKTMEGLDTGETYKAWVRYNDGTATSSWAASNEFTTAILCNPPTNPQVVNVTQHSALVTWEPGQINQDQWITFCDEIDDMDDFIVEEPFRLFTNLDPGTTYHLHVKGDCGYDDGESEQIHIEFTTLPLPSVVVNAGQDADENVPITGDACSEQMSQTQFIIPAEQLTDMQYSHIKSLTFDNQQYTYGRPWGENASFDVYLKVVDQDDFSNGEFYDWDELSFIGSHNPELSGHLMTITISDYHSFYYTGGNLLVGFKQEQYDSTPGTDFGHADWLGVNNYNTDPTYKPSIYYNPSSSEPFAQTFSPKVAFSYEPDTYLPPTDILVTPIAPTEVALTWTPREGQTGTDVQLYDEDMEPIGTPWTWSNGNVFGLGNLSPSTNYYVSLRGRFTVGNETYYSAWTNPVAFTTPEACAAPTNLQVTNVGPFSATLGWSGDAESYEVEYREVTEIQTELSSNFNNPTQLQSWTYWSNEEAGWTMISGGTGLNAYNAMSSDITGTEGEHSHWLITPQIHLPGTLTFKAWGTRGERLAIYVSTTGNDHDDFQRVGTYQQITGQTSTRPQEITVDLSSYLSGYEGNGYIAIGHLKYCDPFIGTTPPTYSVIIDNFVYQTPIYSDWQSAGLTTENSMTVEGLTPGATYQFRVRGTCDTGYDSDWALSDSFATVNNIVFEDEIITKGACLYAWDQNGDGNNDGELSYAEAAAVTELGQALKDQASMALFNELQYFTGLTSIGNYAFAGCVSLAQITLPPQITSIGNYAFGYSTDNQGQIIPCSSLHSIVIPEGVTQIGDYAFSRSGLESIILPFSLTSIGQHAFEHCPLTSVYVPASVNYINNNPFVSESIETIEVDPMNATFDSRNACNAIIRKSDNKLISGCKNTVIPNGVVSIGHGAFEYTTGLTSITLPSSVTTIGQHAFDHCTGLTTIIVESYDPPTIESNAFLNVNTENITVYVPCGSVNTYKNAAGWSSFDNIVGDGCGTSYSLVAGVWKWWAPFEGATAADLMEAFDNGIVQGDILINSQDEGFLRRSGGTWGGTLTSIEPGKMYKILTEASGSFNFTGERPTTVAVELGQDYTWFGFIGNAPVEIRVVLDTTPTDGDKILTEDGHTYTYNEASSLWQSDYGTYISNFTLQTGYGYIYYNASSEPKTLTMQPSY